MEVMITFSKDITLSKYFSYDVNLRDIVTTVGDKYSSLDTIFARTVPVSPLSYRFPYPDPLRYICVDNIGNHLNNESNITRNLESCTNSY